MSDFDKAVGSVRWGKDGLVPVVTQGTDGDVLTLAYVDRDALVKTLDTGHAHYFSRSKNRIRMKGETSGNIQKIKKIRLDCDEDSLLFIVEQEGDACHKGEKTCFHKELSDEIKVAKGGIDYSLQIMKELEAVIMKRKAEPVEDSYTCKLFRDGREKIYKKAGEELIEVLIAEKREDIIYESADLIYHLMVLLAYNDIELADVMEELNRRRGG